MSRTQHFSAPAGLPVYALTFLSEDVLAYAGGGGAGRSGVANAIRTVRVDRGKKELQQLHELSLSRDEDAPMCLASEPKTRSIVCGINSPEAKLKEGANETLRLFQYDEPVTSEKETSEKKAKASDAVAVRFERAVSSLPIRDAEEYQKVAVFSPDGTLLAAASTRGQVALHRVPSLARAWAEPPAPPKAQDGAAQELFDADFSADSSQVVFASGRGIRVFATPAEGAAESDDDAPRLVQTIQNPALGGTSACAFRAARFGRGKKMDGGTSDRLFTVVNAGQTPGAKGKQAKLRKAFITAWDADSWDLIETRHVSDRPVTVFDVSADGRKLAYGSSDLSIGVLDARTLRPIVKILDAHSFPPTALRFSPSGNVLVSASADNTIRVIEVPSKFLVEQSWSETLQLIFVAILLVIIAAYMAHRELLS